MTYPLKKFKHKTTSNRYKIWFEQSKYDLKASLVSFNYHFFEWSSYQAVQSAEKVFKAVIMHAGWQPPKTHKLSVLIGFCNNIDEKFRNTKFKFRDLEVYTFISRYPFVYPGQDLTPHDFITASDAQECIKQAKAIVNFSTKILKLPIGKSSYMDYEGIEGINIQSRVENAIAKIVPEFDPDEIILFGSYARNGDHLSTIDLLIIADTQLNYIERIRKVREITKGSLPVIEPIVYTPRELDVLLRVENDLFLENAMKEGRVVYSRQ